MPILYRFSVVQSSLHMFVGGVCAGRTGRARWGRLSDTRSISHGRGPFVCRLPDVEDKNGPGCTVDFFSCSLAHTYGAEWARFVGSPLLSSRAMQILRCSCLPGLPCLLRCIFFASNVRFSRPCTPPPVRGFGPASLSVSNQYERLASGTSAC